jgi:hypothetical protein
MRSKLSIAAVVAVLLAIAGVSLASADSGGSSNDDGARVIKLLSVVDQETFINVPPDATALGLGARGVFSDVLRDRSSGDRVGTTGGVCTITHVEPEANPTEATAQCVATLSLSGGQIAIQGLVAIPLTQGALPTPVDVAITGGTDDFEGAEGFVTVEELNETDTNLTVHLSGT